MLYVYHQARRAPLIGYQAARNICLNQACWPRPNLLTLALSAGCQAARNICCGEDAAGLARKQRAVAARVPYVSVDLPAIVLGLLIGLGLYGLGSRLGLGVRVKIRVSAG